tara:strand:- start:30 stop:479 length:450 start_codon:yes stop_codon:yes gene_type:complete
MKPITAVVKEKGGAVTYPSNQEVTLNADGSGGPVYNNSPAQFGPQGLGRKGNNGYSVGSPVKQRTVEKGYDPINEAVDPGYKKVVVTRGNKRIVKEKYTDESGRKRKLKTKYKGYSGTFVAQPDVVVSKTFTAKGGGGGRQKEEIKKRQ